MEALLRRPPEEFLPELKGLVYRNPQTEQWETDDQYLSGDVRTKLENARAAASTDPSYQENVTALEAVQPADLAASEIDARLGAVWIPPTDVEAFAKSLLGAEASPFHTRRPSALGLSKATTAPAAQSRTPPNGEPAAIPRWS